MLGSLLILPVCISIGSCIRRDRISKPLVMPIVFMVCLQSVPLVTVRQSMVYFWTGIGDDQSRYTISR